MRPKTLVRFYSNPEWAIDCLEDKEIAAPRASLLNDPFDPDLFILTDCPEYIENFSSVEKSLRKEISDGTFLASFSAPDKNLHPKDNQYLWAHYANGHRGVALEFDFDLLESILEPISMGGEIEDNKIRPIRYGDFQYINKHDWIEFRKGNLEALISKIQDQIFRKTKIWKNENEWRFMFHNSETSQNIRKEKLPDDCITAVYIGLKCENQKAISKQARISFPNALIYKAFKPNGKIDIYFQGNSLIWILEWIS